MVSPRKTTSFTDSSEDVCRDCLARSGCIFLSLPADQWQSFQRAAQVRFYSAGSMVHRQGERCEGVYVLRRGMVRLTHLDSQGRESALGIARPGSLLAVTEVITASPHMLTAVATVDSELEFMPRPRFVPLLLETPELMLSVLMRLSEEHQETVRQLCETTRRTQPPRHRLLDILRNLAETCGRPQEHGVRLPGSISVQDLAAHLGLSRQWTSKILQELIAQGRVRREGRCLVLTERP